MGSNDTYNIIKKDGNSEIVVTKSKFIGFLGSVSTVEEAEGIVNKIRKKYNDARHNCYAYIVMDGDNIIKKASDDGEPSGTAGRPMLAVMEGAELVNAVCVVTRYFGGVLLGTGGLVRAYTDAAAQALEDSEISPIRRGRYVKITIDYPDESTLRRHLENEGFEITDTAYSEKVSLTVLGPEEKAEPLSKRVTDMTGGKASCEMLESVYY
ncbi:MAG: YigZ family protein [Lachnospiraceae bacterium]|nr:YigZ family protein [Lachnospiraceae bacterium]